MSKTIFEQIIDGELDSTVLYEDDDIIAIKDKFPQAPVHALLITKKRIESIHHMEDSDYPLLEKIFRTAKKLAEELGIQDNYRIVTNRGREAGQTIFHLHFHLLGGGTLGPKGG